MSICRSISVYPTKNILRFLNLKFRKFSVIFYSNIISSLFSFFSSEIPIIYVDKLDGITQVSESLIVFFPPSVFLDWIIQLTSIQISLFFFDSHLLLFPVSKYFILIIIPFISSIPTGFYFIILTYLLILLSPFTLVLKCNFIPLFEYMYDM